jgi:hypothetical protein
MMRGAIARAASVACIGVLVGMTSGSAGSQGVPSPAPSPSLPARADLPLNLPGLPLPDALRFDRTQQQVQSVSLPRATHLSAELQASLSASKFSIEQRQLLERVISRSSSDETRNLVVVDGNVVLAASPDRVNAVTLFRAIGENKFASPGGEVFVYPSEGRLAAGPSGTFIPQPTTSTGPFRRVYSKPGFAYISASVYLPCRAALFQTDAQGKPLDVGYVYTGGWGAPPNLVAVDAGFQASSVHDGSSADNYALFLKYGSVYSTVQPRLKCDQLARLEFYPDSASSLKVVATGVDVDGNPLVLPLVYEKPKAADGWDASGHTMQGGVMLKRMTTIAEPDGASVFSTHPDWDRSGIFFGHRPGDPGDTLVRWLNVSIGTLDLATNARSEKSWDMSANGGAQNYPNDPRRVVVEYSDPADEGDAIDLDSR